MFRMLNFPLACKPRPMHISKDTHRISVNGKLDGRL
jgi:hypothetical protein